MIPIRQSQSNFLRFWLVLYIFQMYDELSRYCKFDRMYKRQKAIFFYVLCYISVKVINGKTFQKKGVTKKQFIEDHLANNFRLPQLLKVPNLWVEQNIYIKNIVVSCSCLYLEDKKILISAAKVRHECIIGWQPSVMWKERALVIFSLCICNILVSYWLYIISS